MSREEDLRSDIDWYERAYQEGVSPIDSPYYGMSQEEKERAFAAARVRDDHDRFEAYERRVARERAEMFRNMTPEERRAYEEERERERERAEYYSKMDPSKRAEAYARDMEIIEERRKSEEEEGKRLYEGEMKRQAIMSAKGRYRMLSPFGKLFAKKPEKLNLEAMSIEEIRGLYGGMKR